MPAKKRILVPVDGSASSVRALVHAGERQREAAHYQLVVLIMGNRVSAASTA